MLTQSSRIDIDGPAGLLELLVDRPAPVEPELNALVVICHPHPLYGGTLDNKVVYSLARELAGLGCLAIRFNFRGVGRSEGHFDEGRGELADLLAVVGWGKRQYPERELWLGGFSFGAAVAAHGQPLCDAGRLFLVAPPVTMPYWQGADPAVPTLVVHGGLDELIPVRAASDWADGHPRSTFALVKEADHFFHGQLKPLRELVAAFALANP